MASKYVYTPESKNRSRLVTAIDMAIQQLPDGVVVTPNDLGEFGFYALLQTPYVMLENRNFDMEFEIPFDDDAVANEANFIVYNLNDSTINKFKVGNTVRMTAGYGSDTGVIFEGWISKVKTVRDGVDKVTTIYALDDVKYNAKMLTEATYAAGTKASYILKDLLGRLGLPIEVFKPQRDHIYDDETKVDGSIVQNIKDYSDVCGVSTYICKQRIYSRPIWDGDNLRFMVSSDTGMIGSPEPYQEEKSSEEYTDTVQGYTINMILRHNLTTAGIVKVDSRICSGEYRIVSGMHSYDGLSATTEFNAIADISTTIDQSKVGGQAKSGSSLLDVSWEKREVPNIQTYPKTYMSYRLYTDPTASGYKYLHGAQSWTNAAGFRMYGDCLCCAFGSYYGPNGTFVKVEWTNPSDGSKVPIICVKGDQKKDSETDSKHQYHPMGNGVGSVCEFIVDDEIIKNQSQMYEAAHSQLGIEQQAYISGIWTTDIYPFGTLNGNSEVCESVMELAEEQIGVREAGNNMTKYGADLGNNGVAWCGIFVAWCLKYGGSELPSFNYPSALMYAYAAENNGWGTYHAQGSGYIPKRGDLFVRCYRSGLTHHEDAHVGFVRYDSDGVTFETVEGNSGDMVRSQQTNVASYTFVTPPY